MRRGALNPFFSKRSVTRLEPTIVDKVEQLCSALRDHMRDGKIVMLGAAYSALTTDIISDYGSSIRNPNLALQPHSDNWWDPTWKKTCSADISPKLLDNHCNVFPLRILHLNGRQQ